MLRTNASVCDIRPRAELSLTLKLEAGWSLGRANSNAPKRMHAGCHLFVTRGTTVVLFFGGLHVVVDSETSRRQRGAKP